MVMSITPKQFLELLTQAEVVAVMTSTDVTVVYLRTIFLASERIRGDDPQLLPGINQMRSLNLISEATLNKIKSRMDLA